MFLSATNLVCHRGDHLLFAPVSLTLAAGDALFLVGPNGSGKSTLLRTLAGFFPGYTGDLTLNAATHYLGHTNALDAQLNAAEQIRFWQALFGAALTVDDLLTKLGLAHAATTRVSALSQGQKRRLALAPLLLRNAPVWLLDEPHAALDDPGIMLLQNLITEKRNSSGAVIIASHGGLVLANTRTLHLHAESRAAA